jgi:CYTH domain-containing protein
MEELERTYLLKEFPPGFNESSSKEMLDIYIPSSSDHPHLRIRKWGEKCEITNKQPVVEGNSSRQHELTIPLTEDEYNELATVPGKRVEKTRYFYKESGHTFEIDVFKGKLAGLVLVDIEFKSVEEMDSFQTPSWCLAEVTQEKFIAGGMLCGKSYTDIDAELTGYGYTKHVLNPN